MNTLQPASYLRSADRMAFLMAGLVVALGVFALDITTNMQGAIAVLDVTVPLLIARVGARRDVLLSACGCTILILLAFFVGHWRESVDSAYVRLLVSIVALWVVTALSLRNRFVRTMLAEQARALELTHDTVIIRDADDVIRYWNDGAEQLYGYSRAAAIGSRSRALLDCRYDEAEVGEHLARDGAWAGDVSRTRFDGDRLDLLSRWLQLRDPQGRPIGIMETSADVTSQRRAQIEQQQTEQRYAAIFHAAGFATWESDWSEVYRFVIDRIDASDGNLRDWLQARPDFVREAMQRAVIQEINQAAVTLLDCARGADLIGTSIVGDHVDGESGGFVAILAGLVEGADVVEADTRLRTREGREIDVVVRATLVPGGAPWSRTLVMAFDETERKEARRRLEQASADLAHAARISMLGQLTASIAHEVNQPLSAILTYAKSGKRWLQHDIPDTAETLDCLDQIVANGSRAADVIGRIRSLARKTPVSPETIDLAQIAGEAIALVRRETDRARATVRMVAHDDLPGALGDRVQIQQVIVNLILNAAQAMQAGDKRGEIAVAITLRDDSALELRVTDNGPGFPAGDPGAIFAPFFTTKHDGMGIGLSICRSIVEQQGGRIFAANTDAGGAVVGFTLPIANPRSDETA